MPIQPDPPVIFMVKLPAQLKLALEEESTKTHKTMSAIVKEALSTRLNFNLADIPKSKRGSTRYNTPEERIRAQKVREKERNDTMRTLLKAYKAGEITLPTQTKTKTKETTVNVRRKA